MLKSKYKWQTLAKGIIPNEKIFPTILKNRDIYDFETYFSMGEESLIDPYLLNDMSKAKERILDAINNSESIMIYGDYDCDGICSISLLYRALKKLNADVYYDLPNRFIEGYGLNMRAVDKIIEMGISLVITVDNGVTCIEEVKELNRHGIDTIITDHHEIGKELPDAYAILHTHISENYPFKDIAGVMVSFKLAKALIGDDVSEFYDLVMIGTIADLMPQINENQAIINLGIERLKKTQNLGLQKLIEFSNLDIINVTAISFKIAPKINSSGRLGRALDAVKLLVTESHKEVNELILKIEKNHTSRKKLTEESFNICEKLVNPNDKIIVIASELLHEGVIGICAQKIVEKYQKSALIITIDNDGFGKGSMRSFGNENILELLHKNKELLTRYGGHSQAAGLQIEEAKIPDLTKGLNDIASIGEAPILEADMEVDLCNIEIDTIQYLQDRSFFTASYLFTGLRVVKKQILGYKHTKLLLECHGMKYDALHFNSLEYYYSLENGDLINCIAGMNVNNYRNRKKIQLMIKDIECKDFQVLNLRESDEFDKDLKWIKSDYLFIDDELILNNDINKYLKDSNKKTILIGPKKIKANLNKITQKRELGKIYQLLKEIKEFKLNILLRRIEYNPIIFRYAVKIFFDLGLIVKNEDLYIVKDNVSKTDLQNSPTYVQLVEKKKLIDLVYYDYNSHIKNYFKEIMEA